MKILPKDYNKIIEILYRNPFITYKQIAEHFDKYTTADITQFIADIKNEYINEEAIESFLSNNSTPQDSILFVNGALKSLFKDTLDQSTQLGVLFEEISVFYEKEERQGEDPSYSVLYKYISALILDRKLPSLSETESGLLLTLLYEVLNVSNEMFARQSDFTASFCDNIQTKLAQVVLKSVLDEEQWNKNNENALIKAFNIPQVDSEEYRSEPEEVRNKMQKKVALLSLNPFRVTQEEVSIFKEVVDTIMKEEESNRDIKKIFETIGVVEESAVDCCVPLVASANGGQTIIVHHRKDQSLSKAGRGCAKRTEEEEVIESEIASRFSQHDIINVSAFRESLHDNKHSLSKKKKSD